ncbi:formylglycine-generating enzyme family protein [uncultured Mesotoga sp.]|uniref:formylglycine-generating enzyme family protein n=1 Tax=uncultured Mesotoga sp. TaxID=1184400 RepID=UPI002598A6DC|nr:formylglycine-generating enzyme family protein [uncultured Mesotoga sp.]
MNREVRDGLVEIIANNGNQVLKDSRRLEGLLRDFCGEYRKEIAALVGAMREGIIEELQRSSGGTHINVTIMRLSKRLEDNQALSEEASIWAVETIAIALGIMSEKEAKGVRKAQVERKPVETKTGATYRQDSIESEIKTSNGDELIYVKGGSFIMGDTWGDGFSDEKPTHKVELTYDFYVGKYPVTFDEYDRYCGETGSTKPSDSGWGRGRRPVINVSWNDAIEYCNWLSEKEGLPIAYYGDGSLLDENRRETEDITRVKGYRLLTEAEWEYAARGGKKSMGYKYSGSNSPDSVAWYDSNSGRKTHEVGQKKRNELGLYDMSGNVWEWCSDWYGSYSSSAPTNPYNNSGSGRVIRGGSWVNDAADVRVADRVYNSPASTGYDLGFRIARTVY